MPTAKNRWINSKCHILNLTNENIEFYSVNVCDSNAYKWV